jgi:predicted N-acetyltransferase YhbS
VSVEVRAIRDSEYEECLQLWMRTFEEEESRAYFERYFFGDADFQNDYCRVCAVEGRLVSAVQIVRRTLSFGDFTLTLGGIANVATLPEYQGRGYNTQCMLQAHAVMEADAFDLALLGTDIQGYYARLGWEAVPSLSLSGDLREGIVPDRRGLTVRGARAGDEEAIQAIYRAFNDRRPLTVRRSPAYWRDWVGMRDGRFPTGEARIAERDGVPVGYLFFDLRTDGAQIREIGAAEGGEEALTTLLEEAAAFAQQRGQTHMQWEIPRTPVILAAADSLFARQQTTTDNGAMVRFLHRDNLLRGLAPALTQRWLNAGAPPGSLTFVNPYGATRIETDRFLQILPTEETDGALNQAEMFLLLAGVGLPAGRLTPENGAFARALFPAFDAWYWSFDWF